MSNNDENALSFSKAEYAFGIDKDRRDLPISKSDESSPSAVTNPHSSNNNENVGGKIYNPNYDFGKDYPYNNHKPKPQPTPNVEKRRKRSAPNADVPSTAGGNPKTKKIKTVLDEMDPQRLSEIYKNMHNQLSKINSLLAYSNSSGGGDETPASEVKLSLTDSLTGALSILVKKYGYNTVIELFSEFLNDATISIMPIDYQEIIRNSFISLYITYVIYGEDNIPVSSLPEIINGNNIPTELVSINDVPDLYVQQYYTIDTDPYPGFIEWIGPDDEKIYTARSINDFPYENIDDHVYSLAEQGLAKVLDVYFINTDIKLSVALFLAMLIEFCNLIEDQGIKSSVGKNGNNFSGNLQTLLGSVLGTLTQNALTNHVPNSFLNQTKINNVISKANKMQGRINKSMKPAFKKAAQLETSNITNIISGLTNLSNFNKIEKTDDYQDVVNNLAENVARELSHINKLTGNVNVTPNIEDVDLLISTTTDIKNLLNTTSINSIFNEIKIS